MCTVNKYTFIPVQNIKKRLKEMYPKVKFYASITGPVRIVDSKVVLIIPEKTSDWEIIPSRRPTSVRL